MFISAYTHKGTSNIQQRLHLADLIRLAFLHKNPSKYYELYEMGFLICCFSTRSFFFSGCIICSTFSAVSSISTACSFSYPVRIKFCVIFYSTNSSTLCSLSVYFFLFAFAIYEHCSSSLAPSFSVHLFGSPSFMRVRYLFDDMQHAC